MGDNLRKDAGREPIGPIPAYYKGLGKITSNEYNRFIPSK
jgi:hypothetical protein